MHPPQNKHTVPFDGDVIVGNDILELLSSGMYVEPLSIYREYIQNSADAIDQAGVQGLFEKRDVPAISITLDVANRVASIKDEGAGLSNRAFVRTLTSIGGSSKRGTAARGFRGVGRLAGLGYCQELVMRSKSASDTEVLEMRWDCKRLKELLREASAQSLKEILSTVVTISKSNPHKTAAHFFEVELRGISRFKNDLLLNEELVGRYISEVGPVPFHSSFKFSEQINGLLAQHNVGQAFRTCLNGTDLFRPHRNEYEARLNAPTKFKTIEVFEVPGLNSGFDAVGWILHGEYLGAIPERQRIHGLRLRAGNIQIGDSRLLDSIFPQPRFNAWAVGECHLISGRLVPNARRDDLEHGTHRNNLITHLTPRAVAILKACRTRSAERTRERKAEAGARTGSAINWGSAKGFMTRNADKKLSARHKTQITNKLRNGGLTYAELLQLLTEPARQTKHADEKRNS